VRRRSRRCFFGSLALSLGALVQTKGSMEVVVLTIMLERGVISGTVFSALTLMAVAGTAFAMPLFRLSQRGEEQTMISDAAASSVRAKSTTPVGP